MEATLKKLNYKSEAEVLLNNLPEHLDALKEAFGRTTKCVTDIHEAQNITFALSFIYTQAELDALVPQLDEKMVGDAILWFCYPKKSSKKFKCEIDRDHGWNIMGIHGYEPVRMVALDDDFSALRFRKVSFIKKLTRSEEMALTEDAKSRTTGKKAKKMEE